MGLRFAAIGALAGASALLIWGGEGIRLRAELSRPFLELLPASSGTWEEAQGATPDLKAAVADLGGQVGLAESATEPETEPATESAIEPAAEPAIEALAQPAAQPVAQADLPLPSQGVPNYLGALPLDDDEQGQRLENSVDLRADLVLGALAKETIIRAEPRPGARVLGYARTGSLLRRAAASAGNRGCKGGWYRVEPQGYVCVGNTATLDEEHPVLQIASLQPDRSMAMPYVYARSRYPAPPLYNKLPSQEEQQSAEQDLKGHLQKNFGSLWEDFAGTEAPSLLGEGSMLPRPYGYGHPNRELLSGFAVGNSAFALIDLFGEQGRFFGLTTELRIVPLDRVTPIETSEFQGIELGREVELPVLWVKTHQAQFFHENQSKTGLVPGELAAYRSAIAVTGKRVQMHGLSFYETRDGRFLKENGNLILVDKPAELPRFAKNGRTWIDISLHGQVLVAYRGAEPVYTTLISSGKGGTGDPETEMATVQGTFAIHTKHVTATMSGDTADDEFHLADVPYVQYFHEGYAFHTSYWHDAFGRPRSHGCINLSPKDARYIFTWTEPPVPLGWHSALSHEGTLVQIHP